MCLVMSDSLQPHGLKPSRLPVYEIFQVRILEWVTPFYSSVSFWHRIKPTSLDSLALAGVSPGKPKIYPSSEFLMDVLFQVEEFSFYF